jgi:protein TonB
MKSVPSCLGRALLASLVLHAALIYAGVRLIAPAFRIEPSAPADLKVSLRDPIIEPEAPPPQPALELPPRQLLAPGRAARNASAATPVVEMRPRLEGEAALRAVEQLRSELPYPPEAIERGLQGEALVLLFLDASGNAIAARLESSSGHALLDDAAVRAVRTLRSLPDSAPREALVPVRFRLR